MIKLHRSAYLTTFICLAAGAQVNYDKQQDMYGVNLQTGKEESTRHFEGRFSRTYSAPLSALRASITDVSNKCNNEHKGKRQLLDADFDCKYHLEQTVESVVVKDIGYNWQKEANESERWLVARQVYLRGSYSHYDLVKVLESKNEKGQKTVTVSFTMLNDEDVARYIKPAFKKDSDYTASTETFVLTELSPEKTNLEYSHHSETKHWLLNKEISVPQVFATIGQGMNEVLNTVEKATNRREIASHK